MTWVVPAVSGALGIVSLIMFVWALWLARPPQEARLATAMQDVHMGGEGSDALGDEPWETEDRASSITQMIRQLPWVDKLQVQLLRAGWMIKPSEFVAFSTLSALVLAGLLMVVGHSSRMAIPGVLIAYAGFWLALKSSQANRNRALSAQLPDVLDMLCSSLRAGFWVSQAMNRIQGQTAAPIGDEFRHALEEMRLGRSISAALETMVARTANYDLALVVSAIQTQLEIGGNMAEVLSNIAAMIRERVKLKGEVAVASAEGKLSGVILVAMPAGMGLMIRLMSPNYLDPLLHSHEGKLMLAAAALLMVVGALLLNKLTAIDL